MNKSYDVIIIGGGIMGSSSAFYLTKKGLKVALLERRYVGDGPTGKSSAIIRQHYSNEITARMALHMSRFSKDLKQKSGMNADIIIRDFLWLRERKTVQV